MKNNLKINLAMVACNFSIVSYKLSTLLQSYFKLFSLRWSWVTNILLFTLSFSLKTELWSLGSNLNWLVIKWLLSLIYEYLLMKQIIWNNDIEMCALLRRTEENRIMTVSFNLLFNHHLIWTSASFDLTLWEV